MPAPGERDAGANSTDPHLTVIHARGLVRICRHPLARMPEPITTRQRSRAGHNRGVQF